MDEDRKVLLTDVIVATNTFIAELDNAKDFLQSDSNWLDRFKLLTFGMAIAEMSNKLSTLLKNF